jgi:hypothetical protein
MQSFVYHPRLHGARVIAVLHVGIKQSLPDPPRITAISVDADGELWVFAMDSTGAVERYALRVCTIEF